MSDRAEVLARHVSPDGALIWLIEREAEASGKVVVSFGFEGGHWHLRPDFFVADGRTPEQIATDVTTDLLADRLIVVVDRHSSGSTGYRLLDSIAWELETSGTEAALRFRFWSGCRMDRAELLEETVNFVPLDFEWATQA